MRKIQREIISVSYLYMWYRFLFIYINFNFDFLGLDNIYFENYFANELTKWQSFFKPFKTLVDRVLSHIKHSASRRVL